MTTTGAYNVEGLRNRLEELKRQRQRCGFRNHVRRNWYSNEIVRVSRLLAACEGR